MAAIAVGTKEQLIQFVPALDIHSRHPVVSNWRPLDNGSHLSFKTNFAFSRTISSHISATDITLLPMIFCFFLYYSFFLESHWPLCMGIASRHRFWNGHHLQEPPCYTRDTYFLHLRLITWWHRTTKWYVDKPRWRQTFSGGTGDQFINT